MRSDGPGSRTRRQLLRAGASLAAATAVGGCVIGTEPYRESTDRSFDPQDADALAVVADDGDVTLSPGDGSAVTGTVTKASRSGEDALSEVTVESTLSDGVLRIGVDAPARNLDVTVHFDLSVPNGLAVDRAVTTNGDVRVTDVAGDATCRSDNGDVTVDGVDGYVSLASTNGDVAAERQTGLAGARTTNGDVDVHVPSLRSDASCESTNGDVTAAVPDGLGASVDLRTTNGDLHVESVDLATSRNHERRIRGQLSGDDAAQRTLALRTTNGDVTLRAL